MIADTAATKTSADLTKIKDKIRNQSSQRSRAKAASSFLTQEYMNAKGKCEEPYAAVITSNHSPFSEVMDPADVKTTGLVSFIRKPTSDETTEAKSSEKKPETKKPKEATKAQVQRQQELNKFSCSNILSSCIYLEHQEKYLNQPRYRELDKDLILGDFRLSKMAEMQKQLQEFDDAADA